MPSQVTDFRRVLEVLHQHEVDYVVVGGVGAVLQGAPVTTLDLDLVHSRTAENVDRLLGALLELGARYRIRSDVVIRPDRSHLASTGHHLLTTDAGPLDVLGSLAGGLEYEQVLERSQELFLDGMSIRVQGLEQLIEVKERLSEDKDRAVLPVLRETLREQREKRERE